MLVLDLELRCEYDDHDLSLISDYKINRWEKGKCRDMHELGVCVESDL